MQLQSELRNYPFKGHSYVYAKHLHIHLPNHNHKP